MPRTAAGNKGGGASGGSRGYPHARKKHGGGKGQGQRGKQAQQQGAGEDDPFHFTGQEGKKKGRKMSVSAALVRRRVWACVWVVGGVDDQTHHHPND